MRDSLKTKEYFERVYGFFCGAFEEDYAKYLKKTAQNDLGSWYYIEAHHTVMTVKFERLFYAGYSLGLSKEELGKHLTLFRDSLIGWWSAEGGSYESMLFGLSFAIIYGKNQDYSSPLVELLVKEKYEDFVLDSMAHYLAPDFEVRTEMLKFNKHFASVAETIKLAQTSKDAAVKKLKHYLDKQWLKMQKDGLIKNTSHLKDDKKSMSYLGYWCIEAAALAVMLGLDNTALKECAYYPHDLVHG